jgi:hypothetical protein
MGEKYPAAEISSSNASSITGKIPVLGDYSGWI